MYSSVQGIHCRTGLCIAVFREFNVMLVYVKQCSGNSLSCWSMYSSFQGIHCRADLCIVVFREFTVVLVYV